MKTWIKRTLMGLFGTAVLFGGLAACSHRHHPGSMMSEADVAQMRERFIGKATRELSLDTAQAQGLTRTQFRSSLSSGACYARRFETC